MTVVRCAVCVVQMGRGSDVSKRDGRRSAELEDE